MLRVNVFKECRQLNLRLWECPSFLFLIMGLITIVAMLGTYLVARQYESPEIAIVSVLLVTTILLIIGHSVVRSVARIAEVSRMKSEFVSVASHQLRTPLTSLKWSIGHLARSDLAREQKDYLETIKESNERMIKLVNDLLNVSRIEQGRFELKPEAIDLCAIIQEVIGEITPLAQASNVEMKFQKEKNLPLAFADPLRIRMVVQNLFSNAVQYIKGAGQVKINLSKKDKKILCQVKDTGVGIPAYQQKQVFKKFFRSDNILKHQTQGTGLGLFIAKAIVEGSGGKIGFKSKEGKGSTFWFTVPIKK